MTEHEVEYQTQKLFIEIDTLTRLARQLRKTADNLIAEYDQAHEKVSDAHRRKISDV